jgi:uncharacterized cupin superfamily protein
VARETGSSVSAWPSGVHQRREPPALDGAALRIEDAGDRTGLRRGTMGSAKAQYVVDRVDAEGYEPDIVDGIQVGEFRGLEPKGASANELDVCVWRSDPATYDYVFEKDEAFHVVAGAVTIDLPDTGERIELRVGDIAYFSGGTRSVWTITQPFKKFVVMPG